MDYQEIAERFGGVISTRQLIAAGESAVTIRAAAESGAIDHIRHGWYATKDADADVVEVVRDGCVVSCVDALRRHGLSGSPRAPMERTRV
ncbi:type IV toxin-antitoxin system AbiEi family antitoxin domain-containing protein [Gordonia sp. CPCC 206044]